MPPIRGPSNPPAMGQESYLTRDLLQNQGLQRKPRVWDHHGVKPKVCGQTREKRRVRMRKVYIYIDLCVFQYPKTYLFFLLCQLCPRPRSPGIPVPIHAPSPPWMASRVARCWKRCLSAQKQQG